jgi:hypothetical protein
VSYTCQPIQPNQSVLKCKSSTYRLVRFCQYPGLAAPAVQQQPEEQQQQPEQQQMQCESQYVCVYVCITSTSLCTSSTAIRTNSRLWLDDSHGIVKTRGNIFAHAHRMIGITQKVVQSRLTIDSGDDGLVRYTALSQHHQCHNNCIKTVLENHTPSKAVTLML